MKQYVTGTEEEREIAAATLRVIHGRMKRLREKLSSRSVWRFR